MSEFKSDYYEYSIEWAEEYETWSKDKVSKLQAELESAETYRDLALEANAKLQAVVDAVQLKLRQYMETNDPVAVSYAAQLSRVIEEVENDKEIEGIAP